MHSNRGRVDKCVAHKRDRKLTHFEGSAGGSDVDLQGVVQ